eukprot:TRINITY_DN84342_c0_g1_i1.p1 TRINITY_DN84342_c0_g1~~TRINITY_DN84342_c0_g1_i1.p1  ORF type:complete len:240 (+),score=41.24 TRINITY_DN84342_c0_g1_i1:38-721(+)
MSVSRLEFEVLQKRLQLAESTLQEQGEQIKELKETVSSLELHCSALTSASELQQQQEETVSSPRRPDPPSYQPPLLQPLPKGSCSKGGGIRFTQRNRSRSPRLSRSFSPAGPASRSIEIFANENGLDDRAYEALMAAPWQVQQEVLASGPPRGRNSSALVMSKVGQLIRARDKVERFIRDHGIDHECAEKLRSLEPEIQAAVLAQGSPKGRNPSAMVEGRIRKLTCR